MVIVKISALQRGRVLLTGGRGAGKTTVGRSRAERLGFTISDNDEMIYDSDGCPLSEIVMQ